MLEMLFNAVLGLVFLFFIVFGLQIPRQSRPADIVEAGGFPMIFALVGLVLLAVEVVSQIRKLRRGESETKEEPLYKPGVIRFAIIIAMTVAYILLIRSLGFAVVTLLYTFAALYLLGSKKLSFNAVFAVLSTLVLVLIFGRFFGITLPRGAGFLKTLSFYLY